MSNPLSLSSFKSPDFLKHLSSLLFPLHSSVISSFSLFKDHSSKIHSSKIHPFKSICLFSYVSTF
ncbi:hypothetical protein Hdeb2414_s0006g00206031 [Helianthus debilis subsp. tardiflorus]